MAIGRLAAVSSYLLQLYERAGEADAKAYSSFALDGIRHLLGAHKAWWGVMSVSESGPQLLGSFRSGLPAEYETAWESVKHDDSVTATVARVKNRTVALDADAIPPASGLVRLAEGFDLRQVLSLSVDLPDQKDAFMFVSLYRGQGQRPFTPEDRSINRSLIPHLHAAWKQNLRGRLRTVEDRTQDDVHKAFVDQVGSVVQAEDGFAVSVARRWPTWRGKALPAPLRATVERARFAPGSWIGDDAWAVRAVPAGLLTLIELRQASPLDRLSPRENQVAKLYAEGATHKEIARITGLTPATVRHYLREVYAKLSIDNKASLATLVTRACK